MKAVEMARFVLDAADPKNSYGEKTTVLAQAVLDAEKVMENAYLRYGNPNLPLEWLSKYSSESDDAT